MATIDYGSTNASRYYSFTGPALPVADWCIGFWVRGLNLSGASFNYPFSGGVQGTANSLRVFIPDATPPSFTPYTVTLELFDSGGTSTTLSSPALYTSSTTNYFTVMQRRGSLIEIYVVAKGSTVTGSSASTSTLPTSVVNSFTWLIGTRMDFEVTRFIKGPMGQIFVLTNDSLSSTEIQTLAAGNPITAVRSTRAVDLRFTGINAVEPDLSGNGRNATQFGTGYTTADSFFPILLPQLMLMGVG